MRMKYKDRSVGSFRGKGHDKFINTNVESLPGNDAPLTSSALGHVMFGKPAGSAQKEREQLGRPKGLK